MSFATLCAIQIRRYSIHIRPDKSIPRLKDSSSFYENILKFKQPIIYQNVSSNWSATTKWRNPEYWKSFKTHVPVETKRRDQTCQWAKTLMKLDSFIDKYINRTDSILTGSISRHRLFSQIPVIEQDISIPVFLADSRLEFDKLVSIGSPDFSSPLHREISDFVSVQTVGQKYYRLYYSEVKEYQKEFETKRMSIDSLIKENLKNNDNEPFIECITKPGEALYIPKGYWYLSKDLEYSCTVSFSISEKALVYPK